MVTFSPNSMQLASASWENTVKIMDASSGTYLQTLEGHTSSVQLVSFSDDSTRLASVSRNGMVIIWNVSSGDCVSLRQLHRANHGLSVHSGLSAFSHDLAWLASRTTSNWETVEILDPISGECLSTIKDFNGEQVRSLTFFHVEKWLAIGLDFTIKIWDCTNSRYIQTLQWHRWTGASHISSATAYNSGLLASGLVNGIIMIFSIDSDEAPRVLISHTRWVISMTFSHDSTRLASASEDRTVKIWDLGNSTCLQTFDGHNSPVVSVAFSYDSTQLASVAEDGITKIWDTSGGESMHAPDSHKNSINAVVFSPDSTRLASSSDDCTIKIWDLNSRCLQTLRGHTNEIEMSVFSHHSVWLASASLDSTVRVWDVISGWCLSIFRGHYDKVVAVAFSHDSVMLASASYDHTVKLWNVSTTKCLLTLADHRHYNTSVAFSNDSTQLASLSTDGTVRVWNTRNGENLQTLNCSKDPPVPRLTHYSSYDPSLSRLTHYSSFKFIALSHDATQLALVSNNGFIEIWERNHSKCLQAIYVGKQLSNVSFHASGLYLSTDVGLIAIPASSDPDERVVAPNLQSTPHYTAGLSIDGKWITYNSINVLRLPSEYRPSRSAVSGDLVAMAVGGRVFICTLSRSCSSK
jgi:WD40 repeat protein